MRKPYPSDLTDAQWALVEPLIPAEKTGRPRQVDMREVLNAIFYIDRAGCQWDMLPHDLPAKSTVYDHFAHWRDDGTWDRIKDALIRKVRVGYDGGKKITGVKRHIIVDSLGLLLVVVVTSAASDDGTIAPQVLRRLSADHLRRLEVVRGDSKYRNKALDRYLARPGVGYRIEVIRRPGDAKGFVLLPKRWVVERSHAWHGRYRRQSRHYEWYMSSAESMIKVGAIQNMLRRLDPNPGKANPFHYPKKQPLITG